MGTIGLNEGPAEAAERGGGLRRPDQYADAIATRVIGAMRDADRVYRTSRTACGSGLKHEAVLATRTPDEDAAVYAIARCAAREALHLAGCWGGERLPEHAGERPLAVLGQGDYRRVIGGEPPSRRRAAALGGVLRRLFGGGDAR